MTPSISSRQRKDRIRYSTLVTLTSRSAQHPSSIASARDATLRSSGRHTEWLLGVNTILVTLHRSSTQYPSSIASARDATLRSSGHTEWLLRVNTILVTLHRSSTQYVILTLSPSHRLTLYLTYFLLALVFDESTLRSDFTALPSHRELSSYLANCHLPLRDFTSHRLAPTFLYFILL